MRVTTPVVGNSIGRSTDCIMTKFKDPSKRQRVIERVGWTGNECLCTKFLFIKQWVELESTRTWSDKRARKDIETRGIKEFELKRVDTLSGTSLGALPESMQLLKGAEAQELLTLFLT